MMESVAIVATGLADTLAPTTKIDAIAADLISHEPVAIAADGRVIELPKTLQQELQAALVNLQPKRNGLAGFVGWMQSGPLVRSQTPTARPKALTLPVHPPETTVGPLADLWALPTPQEPFSLQVLIQSAMAYFFGSHATRQLAAANGDERHSELASATNFSTLEPATAAPTPSLKQTPVASWLAYEDLFPAGLLPVTTGDRAEFSGGSEDTPSSTASPEGLELGGADLFLSAPPSIEAKTAKAAIDSNNGDTVALSAEGTAPDTPKSSAPITVAKPVAIAAREAPNRAKQADLETALDSLGDLSNVEMADDPSEYLNVRVVASRYIKNPLEVIIDGLDRLLSWLEDWASGLWRRLRGWIAKRFGDR